MKPLVFGGQSKNSLIGAEQSLAVWLNALAVVQRPTHIVHVGIGDGRGDSCVWTQWPLVKVLAIDSEPVSVDVLSLNPQTQEIIEVQSHVIAGVEGRIAYFVASNPAESGLIDPNLLRMVWPSLTLSHQVQRDVTTLDRAAVNMLDADEGVSTDSLWLIIDALPGVSILSGGLKLLGLSSLVCVRVLAEPGFRGEPSGADITSVDYFLEDKGYARLIYLPGMNPKIGHALYARRQSIDAKNGAVESENSHQLLKAQQEIEALNISLQQTTDNLRAVQAKLDIALKECDASEMALKVALQERDSAQAASAALGTQLQEQTQAKEQALQQLAEAKQSAQALTASLQQSSESLHAVQVKLEETLQERDTVQATTANLESQLKEQMQAKEQALHQLAEAKQSEQSLISSSQQSSEHLRAVQAKLDETLQERDAAQAKTATLESQLHEQMQAKEKALSQLAEIHQLYDSLTDTLKTKDATLESELLKVQRLTVENTELTHRQKLMNEELVKAEGQISLIKDLLLREQGL